MSPERRETVRLRNHQRRQARGYTAVNRAADARRRAWKRGALVERFTPAEIFERDRWRCGICHKAVRRNVAYPDPFSASLDHIVPLSKGGAHSRVNVRLAHLNCNIARGNRGAPEQLALLG
jgi:5-methylcytosine-specific restriction endonuclease McrA